jgi:multimeric flavodoxin WrbA
MTSAADTPAGPDAERSRGERVLGLSAGNPDGSAEILLKVALRAAEDEGAEVVLVRLAELTLPTRPVTPGQPAVADDGSWLWDQVMESDGLIVSTPIYSRTVPGTLKLVADRLSGPAADVAFAESYRAMLEAGKTPPVAFPYDERVFRPRVAGLIAVGGALSGRWKSLALPLMHQMMFSSHIAVADQLLVGGAGMPRAVVLDARALRNAARVGRSVGSQLGRPFDEVEYRGASGLCPLCHLSTVTVCGDEVECATCGAAGRLTIQDGTPAVSFGDPDGLERSVIRLGEKRAHFREVQETGQVQGPLEAEIAQRASLYVAYERRITPARDPGVADQAERRATQ